MLVHSRKMSPPQPQAARSHATRHVHRTALRLWLCCRDTATFRPCMTRCPAGPVNRLDAHRVDSPGSVSPHMSAAIVCARLHVQKHLVSAPARASRTPRQAAAPWWR